MPRRPKRSVQPGTIAAAEFKATCLELMDRVRETAAEYIVTKHGKPVAITEFGCCTYEGAEAKGAAGWGIVDTSNARRKIKGGFLRSEDTQARYLTELLDMFLQEPIEGSFVFNFASYNLPTDENPEFDLDMASYGIVKVLPDGEKGATYQDMPWEPKKAFRMVAEQYGRESHQLV